jgi:hypothetical protein
MEIFGIERLAKIWKEIVITFASILSHFFNNNQKHNKYTNMNALVSKTRRVSKCGAIVINKVTACQVLDAMFSFACNSTSHRRLSYNSVN